MEWRAFHNPLGTSGPWGGPVKAHGARRSSFRGLPMKTLYYRLEGHEPVPVNDVLEFARLFETMDRRVAQTDLGSCYVSTVFLGIDHNHSGIGDPILFETMVFDKRDESLLCERCCTWAEAEEQHAQVVAQIQAEGNEAHGPRNPR